MSGSITLNSVTFHPSDVQLERSKIGVSLIAQNGTRRFVHRLNGATPIYKNVWTIPWKIVPEATRTAILAIYAITSVFVFTDQFGASWVAACEADGYSENVAVIVSNTETYYDVTLKIYQQ